MNKEDFFVGFIVGAITLFVTMTFFSIPTYKHRRICVEYGIAEYDNTTGVFKMKPKPEN